MEAADFSNMTCSRLLEIYPLMQILNMLNRCLFLALLMTVGIVIATTIPIIPKVINISAIVNAFLFINPPTVLAIL